LTGPDLDPETERQLGVGLFNHVWSLLALDERTPEQVDELLHAAHASAYHWRQVGGPANFARSEWQCSRVYSVLGRPEQALWHARRCLELCEQHGIGDWDLAFAYEALARAHSVAGERGESERFVELARAQPIAEDEERELLLADLATI
jgi:hypothetical protein